MKLPHIRIARSNYSSAVTKYPSKVRAFPFVISQEDAIVQLGPYASRASVSGGLLGSLGARFLPGFGFKPLQPTRIQPVYLPAWFVDAEVEAKAVTADNEGQPHAVTAFLHNSYMPGFVFQPLSQLSFNNIPTTDPIPFSNDLEHQFNAEVLCLPYVISPLYLPEAVRSLSYKQATISDELRFIPNSVQPNLLAAYPVLIPVYLAQYTTSLTFANEQTSITVVLEAHSPNGRIFCEELPEIAQFFNGYNPVTTWRGSTAPFARVKHLLGPKMKSNMASELAGHLDDMICAQGAAEALATGGVGDEGATHVRVNMEDLRVRDYAVEEKKQNRLWLAVSAELAALGTMLENISHIQHAKVITFEFGSPPKQSRMLEDKVDSKTMGPLSIQGGDQFARTVVERMAELKENRKKLKPQWWKDWETTASIKAV